MNYFPFYLNISNKTFLIIGGGPVALEKVSRLRRFTEDIVVVAPATQIEGAVVDQPLRAAGRVQILRREYREEDLDFGDYVVAATGVREVDRKVASDCRRRGIPVNTVDDPEYCDFIFPAIVRRDSLTVAVSTSGTSPAYAMQLRREIEDMLPPDIGPILTRMGNLRSKVTLKVAVQKRRAAAYRKILAALIESGNQLSNEEIDGIIDEAAETAP